MEMSRVSTGLASLSSNLVLNMSTDALTSFGNWSNATTISPPFTKERTAAVMLQERMNLAQYFICPTLLVFGIFGNLCTVLTISHRQFRDMTSRYILYALATSDTMLLLTTPFNQQFMVKLWNEDVRAISEAGCKLFFVMYRAGKMSSSWFIVLIAFERFIAVIYPLQARRFLRKASLSVAIVCVYVVIFSITGVWTFSTNIVNEMCMSNVASIETKKLHKYFVIVGATFYSITPMFILLTLTPVIVVNLCRTQRQRHFLQHSNREKSAREALRVSAMLIGIVINYIICVTPITLVLILTFWTNEPFFTSQKPEYIILTGVAMSFEQLNHSSNFIIYIMCCRQFRQRFFRMMRCTTMIPQAASTSFGASNDNELNTYCTGVNNVCESEPTP